MLICEELARKQARKAAIYLDDHHKIKIKKDLCIGCEECLERCGLFRIVNGIYMERRYQQEFDNDPRSHINLTVERFGCDIMDRVYLLKTINDIEKYINKSNNGIKILEFVLEQTVYCPIQGIEVDAVISQLPAINEYRKIVISDNEQYEESFESFFNKQKHTLNLQSFPFPSIVLIKNQNIVGKPIELCKVIHESSRNGLQQSLVVKIQEQIEGLKES